MRNRLAALALLAAMSPATAQRLSVYTWSGYELPQFHPAFLAHHPQDAAIAVFGNDDEAFAKIKAGFSPDIAHPCIDKLPLWRKAGLIQPIDPTRIAQWDHLFPVLRQLPEVSADGKIWMLPWDWANTSVTYRTDLVAATPDSWNILWDPRYAQRLAMIDAIHDSWIVGALMAHVDPFEESAADVSKVADALRKQLPLIRMYTNDMTTVEQALASGELIAAMTWNSSYVSLHRQGIKVAFLQPKERMLTWACGLVLMKNAHDLDQAYEFLNAMADPRSGVALMRAYGYGTANQDAFDSVPAAERSDMALPADPEQALRQTIFVRPMQNRDAIAATFEMVKAGG